MAKKETTTTDNSSQRIDKWLWTARFFKTRRLAQDAIALGHVTVNGERPKTSRILKLGDQVEIQIQQLPWKVEVLGFNAQRRPAKEAQSLYQEDETAQQQREQIRLRIQAERLSSPTTEGRPTKKDRRNILQLKRQ